MKAIFHKFRTFIEKHIWADFLFIFLVYGSLSLAFEGFWYKKDVSIGYFILNIGIFSVIMTLILRYTRGKRSKPHPMELGDRAAYFAKGQRSQLKAYLESKGYKVARNEGSTTYFDPPNSSKSQLGATFIYEADHWMALIASPEIQINIPSDIATLYALTDRML